MAALVATEVSTLGDLLLRAADRVPDRLALVLPTQKATFAELRDGAIRVARSLLANGVRPGDHVGILIPNCIEYAECLFGVALLGCVAVPLNARHKATELGYIINNASVTALLTSNHADDPVNFCDVLSEAFAASRPAALKFVALIRGTAAGDTIDPATFRAAAETTATDAIETARQRVRVRGPALIIYTSGTTANPKGCVLSHEAVTRGPVERARYRLSVGDHNVTWGAGPLFHIGTLAPFIGSVGCAGTFLTDTYFEPGRALQLMYDHNVTLVWPWFSAIAQGLIGHPDFDAGRLSALRYLFIIAPPTLVDEVQRLFPQTEVIQACGMTETAGIFALADASDTPEERSIKQGRPSPGVEVRIVDPETGIDLRDGTTGEIWVRGYNVMDEYWAAPEKTAEALTGDGWLKTGDLYTRDPDGNLIFGGRHKDMLKVGGENVAAIEVEAFLCTHTSVKTAEVVGRPDIRLDEVPVAFVELYENEIADEETLIAHCRGQIASYKVPRAVHFVLPGEWPMSATKIDKRALRERLASLK